MSSNDVVEAAEFDEEPRVHVWLGGETNGAGEKRLPDGRLTPDEARELAFDLEVAANRADPPDTIEPDNEKWVIKWER